MKRKKIIISALGLLVLSGCGGKKKEEVKESIPFDDQTEVTTEIVVPKDTFFLTKDNIGPIHIGMSVNNIPDSVADLYGEKEIGASEDAVTITFLDGNMESFIAYDFGESKVDVINLINKAVKVNAPRGAFGLGDKFSKVLELPGVTTEWSAYDGNGSWYWVWEGLWFAPSQETLTETLSRRLYHSGSAPTVADFSDDVTVGFIGTGLPF